MNRGEDFEDVLDVLEQQSKDREKKREARDNGRAEAKGGGTGHRWSQVAVSHRWLLVIDGC